MATTVVGNGHNPNIACNNLVDDEIGKPSQSNESKSVYSKWRTQFREGGDLTCRVLKFSLKIASEFHSDCEVLVEDFFVLILRVVFEIKAH